MDTYDRTRSRLYKKTSWEQTTDIGGSPGEPVTGELISREITQDRKNPWGNSGLVGDIKLWRSRVKELNLDIGGPFLSQKWFHEVDGKIYRPVTSDGFVSAVGPQFPFSQYADPAAAYDRLVCWGDYIPTSDEDLDALGSTAISRCAPTNPHASALNALVELYRDGLPHAITLNSLRRGMSADEYLNYEFGILPLASDIKSIGSSYLNADKLLRQYYRDSGRVVRRRYSFPPDVRVVEDSVQDGVQPQPGFHPWLYDVPYGQLRKVVTETRKVWFSGAFTYYAQPPSSVLAISDQVEKYNYLYGISPSMSVLWDALPYSWAVDWVSNMGDVMNNVSLFLEDGLVMVYGYVMEHFVRRIEYTHTGTVLAGAGPVTATQTFTYEYKRRRGATPFGFGLSSDGFTARQWAILVALGMSRGKEAR